ncbi:hypothetical protein ONS96_012981 [Cadophora gregata f. sp. sojae]|nr:hypothetical protein ONS96_012981 [Cadophora gregata f. sp. sojae]
MTEYDPTLMEPMTKWESIIDGNKCTIEAIIAGTGDLDDHFVKGTLLGRGIHGAVVTWDVTLREQFASIEDQVLEVKKLGTEHLPGGVVYPVVVAFTKMDLIDGNDSIGMGDDFVAKLGLTGYFNTSAVSGDGVDEPFSSVVREVWRRDGYPAREEVPIPVSRKGREDVPPTKGDWSVNLKAKLRKILS